MSNREQLFLNFEDKDQKVIKLTYAKGGLWLPSIGFTNLLCARFTCMTTGHAPIGEYRQRFLTSPSATCAAKLKFKHKNILSWNVIHMTHPYIHAISS